MNFSGNYCFQEKIDKIWDDLNNPEILKKSIQGCKEFIEKAQDTFFFKIQVKIGPINATFTGELKIINKNPPFSYIIEAKGNAGQLGGASGKVEIKLNEKDSTTNLFYTADTKINGKIAQLGSRLIEGTVKKNTTLFFNSFENISSSKNSANYEEVIKREKIIENKITINNLNKKYLYAFFIILIVLFIIIINYE